MDAPVSGGDDAAAALCGFAVPGGDDAAGAGNDRDQRRDVVGLEFGLDHKVEVPSGQLVGLVEGYRTARVNIDERRSFDVPMPGETFVTPVTKLRAFLVDHLEAKAHPALPAPVVAPVTRSASIAPH